MHGHSGAGDGHLAASCLVGHDDRLGCALERTAPVDADAPDRGQNQRASVQPHAVALLLEGEGVGAIPPRDARDSRLLAAPKERLRGLVYPRHHVVHKMRVAGVVVGGTRRGWPLSSACCSTRETQTDRRWEAVIRCSTAAVERSRQRHSTS
jgi:hypothetical protein